MSHPRPLAVLFALSALVLACAPPSPAQGALSGQARPSGLTVQQWQEDLDFLARTVAEKHRHPFDRLARADFDKAVAALRERIPVLADH